MLLSETQKRKMQRGRKQKIKLEKQRQRRQFQYGVTQLDERKQLALSLHGCLLTMVPIPKERIDEMIRWWNEAKRVNLPKFVGKLRTFNNYFLILDYLAEPNEGFPIVAQTGWQKPFTFEEAQKFIERYEPKLISLSGTQLARYVATHNGDGKLRTTFDTM